MAIDSHHHFWSFDPAEYAWIDQEVGILNRDFMPADLEAAVSGLGIDGVVSVQARCSLDETDALLEHGAENPLVRGVVGWVPLKANPGECLDSLTSNPLLKGVREICQGEPAENFFANDAFSAGVRELTRRDLVYDLLLFQDQLSDVIRFVDSHPSQRFVLDHIAKPEIRSSGFADDWAIQLRELAERSQVIACKFSGVVTEVRDEDWGVGLIRPYFETALEAFGPDRLMFGSDWPVCLLRTSYSDWVRVARELSGSMLSPSEADRFWEKNAIGAYSL